MNLLFFIETVCYRYRDSEGLKSLFYVICLLVCFPVSLCNALNFTAHNGSSLLIMYNNMQFEDSKISSVSSWLLNLSCAFLTLTLAKTIHGQLPLVL